MQSYDVSTGCGEASLGAAEVAKTIERLKAAAGERTRELERHKSCAAEAIQKLQVAQTQLLQADKMASIGQLAAGVAHEINNPIAFISSNLNSLANYTKILKRVLELYGALLLACLKQPNELAGQAAAVERVCKDCDLEYVVKDLEQLVEESLEGAQRVRQIVVDLRDFSHVDSPDVTDTDINKLFDKTINVAWNELKYKAEVVREYGNIPTIPCYGGKLGQVFLNLLVNAAQAIGERGRITVRTGRGDSCVWAEVQDTGCGIPPENLNRVFEPFFTTKEVGKGTGMGLHLAYKIIEAHGGKITVQSEVSKGTTFRVELPLSGPPKDRRQGAVT